MSFVVDGHGHGLEDDGEAVSPFGGHDQRRGKVVELNGLRGQVISLSVELLGRHADEPIVDPVVPKVAGDYLDAKEVGLGLQHAVDLTPEVTLRPVGWGWVTIREGREAVYDSLVVDEDVHRPFGSGDQVQEGEGFRSLGVLGEAVDPRRVVEAVVVAVVDAKGSPGEEGDSLVRASSVSAGVGPAPAGVRVGIAGELVAVGPFGRWSGDRLGGIPRELRL